MLCVYVLELENKKYYVGKTTNFDERFKQHKNGVGSFWTKKYKPIKVVEIVKNVSNFDEDKYVKIYMAKITFFFCFFYLQ